MTSGVRPYANASLAVIGAGLIAAAPAVQPAIDPQHRLVELTASATGGLVDLLDGLGRAYEAVLDGGVAAPTAAIPLPPGTGVFDYTTIAAAVATLGQSQISQGLTDFVNGDFGPGLVGVVTGLNNLLIAAPENLLLGPIEASVGGNWSSWEFFSELPPAVNLETYLANIQAVLNSIVESFGKGISEIGLGPIEHGTNEGLASIVQGLNNTFVSLPEHLLLGPVVILLSGVSNMVDSVQSFTDHGGNQITTGVTEILGGSPADGVWHAASGVANVVIGAPEAAITSAINSASGEELFLDPPFIELGGWSGFDGLLGDVQALFENSLTSFGVAVEHLLNADLDFALAALVHGLNDLLVEIPADVILGPVTMLLDGF